MNGAEEEKDDPDMPWWESGKGHEIRQSSQCWLQVTQVQLTQGTQYDTYEVGEPVGPWSPREDSHTTASTCPHCSLKHMT